MISESSESTSNLKTTEEEIESSSNSDASQEFLSSNELDNKPK